MGIPGIARAQTPPADQSTPAPTFATEIVVTPERGEAERSLVPASTVVLSGTALPALPAVQLGEIATYLPGFQIQQAQPYSTTPLISARGFFGGGEAEYVQLLVDGVPQMDAESGLIDWAAVPASSIRRIEAFRGPGASLYGDSAIGGVIQILTDRAANGGALTMSGGSFGTFVGDGSWSRRSPSFGAMLSGTALRTDGASDHSEAHRLTLGGALDGRWRQAAWHWTLTGTDRTRDDPGALSATAFDRDPFASDPIFRFDTLDRRNVSTAFTIDTPAGAWRHRARAHVGGRRDDLVRTILLAPGLGDRSGRHLTTSVVGGSVESDRAFRLADSTASVRLGLDLSHEHVDTAYRPVNDAGVAGAVRAEGSGARVRAGAFASSAWEPARRLRLSAGARWDRINDDVSSVQSANRSHEAWSPRAGVTVRVVDDGSVTAFLQASKAFKAPTLDQLFDVRPYPDFRGGTFTISNPRLVPQRATNVEAGISGASPSGIRWSVLGYRMMVDHEIDFDVRTFSYANIGQSRHLGLELETGTTSWRRVHPEFSYAFVKVNEPDNPLQLKNVPRHVATASLGIDAPWQLSVFLRYRRTSGGFLDDENRFAIDGPSTLDLRLRRSVGRHLVFLDLLNLANDRYQEYGYTLTDFRGGVVPYSYPGAPRGLRLGATLGF